MSFRATRTTRTERKKANDRDRTRAALARSPHDAAHQGNVCRTPSCHSRDGVRTVIGADDEPVVLCDHCRTLYPVGGDQR